MSDGRLKTEVEPAQQATPAAPLPSGAVVTGAQILKWNRDIRDFEVQKRNLWMGLFGSFAVIVALAASNVWLASKSHVEVVQVNRAGEGDVLSVNSLHQATPTDKHIQYDLKHFIANLRTISPDWHAIATNLKATHVMVRRGSQANRFLEDFFQNNDPYKRSKDVYTEIVEQTALLSSRDDSGKNQQWATTWIEKTYSTKDNMLLSTAHWRAHINFTINDNPRLPAIADNPDDLLINFITWQQSNNQ